MMKLLKWGLISVLSLVLVILLAGYIIVTQIDFGKYKETIISAVYDATGRKMTLGEVSVKVSLRPNIEIHNVTLENAAWGKQPLMVAAERVNLGFSLLALIGGKYEISNFVVNNMEVNLEENSDGKANWNFAKEEPQIKAAGFSLVKCAYADDLNKENSVSKLLSALVIKNIELDKVKLNYTDKNAKTIGYKINLLKLHENDEESIDFLFDVNDGLYKGRGSLGTLEKLESKKGYPIVADLSIMGIKAQADMVLFDIFTSVKFKGKLTAQEFLGNQYAEEINMHLEGGLDKISAVIDKITLAGNEANGKIMADMVTKVPTIKAQLSAPKIDISSFEKKTAYNFSVIKSAQATSLASYKDIPYALLNSVDANAEVNIAQIVNKKDLIAKNLVLNAQVNDGIAKFEILRGQVADGTIRSDATLTAQDKTLLLNVDVGSVNLKKLAEAFNFSSQSFNFISGSNTDVYMNLVGKGNSFADIIDSLDGQTAIVLNESKMHLGNVGILKGNIISQLVNTLNLTKGNDDLDLRCAVIRGDFKEGKVKFPNGIVVNADKFTVVASGSLNLKKDKIDISIKPFAGKLTDTNIAKAISSLVKLTGTLQKPKIGVDSVNAIKTIVGVTTAGPVYLGAQMLLENDGAPCYTALEGTKFENKFPKPKSTVNQTSEDVGKIFDSSVGAVKSTTKEILNIFSGSAKRK